jgi:hypothetical protein
MERIVLPVLGPADRLLLTGLDDLQPLFRELHGHVLVIGGFMVRAWLQLRPLEGLAARPTVDIDLGLDRRGLGLTSASRRVGPLLEGLGYAAVPGEESFRHRRDLGGGRVVSVDLLIARGAARDEPPVLEHGMTTIAAPGMAYAIARGGQDVEVRFVDDGREAVLTVPLPTLDAAFVLKAALVGRRNRPDRLRRDRVDAVMLAAACLRDADAVGALQRPINREARRAIAWLRESLGDGQGAVARDLDAHLRDEHGIPDGGDWAVSVAQRLLRATAS